MNSIKYQIIKDLNSIGLKPKKSLGQNFLISEGVYKKIVKTLKIRPGNKIVEVGPGLGTLTEFLARAGAKVTAIEKDGNLSIYLKNKFRGTKNVTIVNEDILKFNPASYDLRLTTYSLAGNIPYYLTSRLIRTVFDKWPRPAMVIFAVQKEVAQRMSAKPPNMSLLSVAVQYYAAPEIVSYVKKESFWPKPEVDSAIIKLAPRMRTAPGVMPPPTPGVETSLTPGVGGGGVRTSETPSVEEGGVRTSLTPGVEEGVRGAGTSLTPGMGGCGVENFFRVVKAGFSAKRKQLGNNLSAKLGIPKRIIESKLKKAGIDPKRRAETLTVEEWKRLTTSIDLRSR